MRQRLRSKKVSWESGRIRELRRHLGLTQTELAQELGTRQQTISEWEVGMYRPRGASAKLLSIVAERAGFQYEVESGKKAGAEQPFSTLASRPGEAQSPKRDV